MNPAKLKAAMVLRCTNGERLASMIGISESAFYRKMNSVSEFTIKEVHRIRDALKLSEEEVINIFFEQEVS